MGGMAVACAPGGRTKRKRRRRAVSSAPPPPGHDTPYEELHDIGAAEIAPDPGSDYLVTVQISPAYEHLLDADRLHRLATGVLRAEGMAGPLEVGVFVTTDEEVHALNREYLGHDYE